MLPSVKSSSSGSADSYSGFYLYNSIKKNNQVVKGRFAFFNDCNETTRNDLMAQIFKKLSPLEISNFSKVNRSSYLMLKEYSPELINFLIPGKSMRACVLMGGEREMYTMLEKESIKLSSDRCLYQFSFVYNKDTILRPAVELEVGIVRPTLKCTYKKWIFSSRFEPTHFKDGLPLFSEWINENPNTKHFTMGDKVYFDLSRMPGTRAILFTPEDTTEEKIKFDLVAFFLRNCARINIKPYDEFQNDVIAKQELSKILYLKLCELKPRNQFKTRDEFLEYRAREQNAKDERFQKFFANMLKDPEKYYNICEQFGSTLPNEQKDVFLRTLKRDRANYLKRQDLLKVTTAAKMIAPKKINNTSQQAEESEFDKFVSEKVNAFKSLFNF